MRSCESEAGGRRLWGMGGTEEEEAKVDIYYRRKEERKITKL